MKTAKNNMTFLVTCKDKENCKTMIKKLERKIRKNILAIHETIPFSDPDKIESKIENPTMIKIGNADYIIEIVTKKHNERESIMNEFNNFLPSNIASLTIV
jgi:hypothetical protein